MPRPPGRSAPHRSVEPTTGRFVDLDHVVREAADLPAPPRLDLRGVHVRLLPALASKRDALRERGVNHRTAASAGMRHDGDPLAASENRLLFQRLTWVWLAWASVSGSSKPGLGWSPADLNPRSGRRPREGRTAPRCRLPLGRSPRARNCQLVARRPCTVVRAQPDRPPWLRSRDA